MTRLLMIGRVFIISICLIGIANGATFTSPEGGNVDWAHVNFVNEIFTSYREHRWVTGDSTSILMTAGMDATKKGGTADASGSNYWLELQEWMENNADEFIDIRDQASWTNAGTIPMWSWDTNLWIYAGISTSGWRRATAWNPAVDVWTNTADAMYLYGQIQAGDIVGPWIMDDFQRILHAYQASRISLSDPDALLPTNAVYGELDRRADLTVAHINQTNAWNTFDSGWIPPWTNLLAFSIWYKEAGWIKLGPPTGNYEAKGHAEWELFTVVSPTTNLNFWAEIYFYPHHSVSAAFFNDVDGHGWRFHELWLYTAIGSSTNTTNAAVVAAWPPEPNGDNIIEQFGGSLDPLVLLTGTTNRGPTSILFGSSKAVVWWDWSYTK